MSIENPAQGPAEQSTESVDLVIVGGGAVGIALALALARSAPGLGVALVEPRPPGPPHELPRGAAALRTVAVSPGHFRWLCALLGDALAEPLRAASCRYERMQVWDAEGSGRVDFDAAELEAAELGMIVPSALLRALLWARLAAFDVRRIEHAGLSALEAAGPGDAGRWRLRLDTAGRGVAAPDRLDAALLVGADGARSALADMLGVRNRERDYGQHAVVADVVFERPHDHCARQAFLRSGPVGVLPLPDPMSGVDGPTGRRCNIVWSIDAAMAAALADADDAQWSARLARALDHCLGGVVSTTPRASFPLVARHRERYAGNGFVLVGDAAHVVHPLAGLGVNLGFRDVRLLADMIAAQVRRPGFRPTHLGDAAWLARFERQRRGENGAIQGALTGLQQLFASNDPLVHLARNFGLQQVNRQALARRLFMHLAMG